MSAESAVEMALLKAIATVRATNSMSAESAVEMALLKAIATVTATY